MILQTIYGCDGCRRKMTEPDLEAHRNNVRAYIDSHPGQNLSHITEIFCPCCAPFAHDYWDAKPQIAADALKVFNNRIENHRREFFQQRVIAAQRPMKVVK